MPVVNKAKDTGIEYLVFDPRIPNDLPDQKAQKLWDEQKAARSLQKSKMAEFIAHMQDVAVKGGSEHKPAVIINRWGTVSLTGADEKYAKKAVRRESQPGKTVDWKVAGSQLFKPITS